MAASLIPTPSICSTSFPSLKLPYFTHSYSSLKSHLSFYTPTLFLNSPLTPFSPIPKFKLYSTVQELVQETVEEEKYKKLYVVNLQWNVSADDIKTLFGECGTVRDVEIIKQKDGKNKGYAFIKMASTEECQAVIDKFNSYELSGRVIRVEFAKGFKKPLPPRAIGTPRAETRHRLYVSNVAWKARSSHLRQLFFADFNPVSARVVFNNPNGRSAGYGFVSFATREEAEAALAAMEGKELMGRPIHLKFSEKVTNESGSEMEESNSKDDSEEKDNIIGQLEES